MTANPKDLVGAKKAPLRYVPPALMIAASGPMENGALKYGPYNWREYPVEVVTYIEAAIRHLYAFLDGQDLAEDSGLPHIDHAIAGLGIVVDSREMGTLIDNRFRAGPSADMLRDRDRSVTVEADDTLTQAMAAAERALDEPWGTGDGPITVFASSQRELLEQERAMYSPGGSLWGLDIPFRLIHLDDEEYDYLCPMCVRGG